MHTAVIWLLWTAAVISSWKSSKLFSDIVVAGTYGVQQDESAVLHIGLAPGEYSSGEAQDPR